MWKRRKDLLYLGSYHGGELPEFFGQTGDYLGTDAISMRAPFLIPCDITHLRGSHQSISSTATTPTTLAVPRSRAGYRTSLGLNTSWTARRCFCSATTPLKSTRQSQTLIVQRVLKLRSRSKRLWDPENPEPFPCQRSLALSHYVFVS